MSWTSIAATCHSPLDLPLQRTRLVKREIVAGSVAEQFYYAGQPVFWCILCLRLMAQAADVSVPGKRIWHIGDRQHMIHDTRQNGAFRHARISGFGRVLRDHQAAGFLDRREPDTAVAPGSRQDDARRPVSVFGGQGVQQEIEREPRAMMRPGVR